MYEPLHAKSGVTLAAEQVGAVRVRPPTPDGLEVVPPTTEVAEFGTIRIPERLQGWLDDLRLLRHVPLAYLVPDARLLPPESIRFFHVDQTWIDRLIDGAFAAAHLGSFDATVTAGIMPAVRDALDADIANQAQTGWKPGDPMTGMLIRSELVRRWPEVEVAAYADTAAVAASKPLATLRREPVSRDVLIALFGGLPQVLHLTEPHVGTRFGVEPRTGPGAPFQVDARNGDGQSIPNADPVPIFYKNETLRTLLLAPREPARSIAIDLEQRAYQLVFTGEDEASGYVPLSAMRELDGTLKMIPLRKGRKVSLDGHARRLAAQVTR